MIHRVDVVLPCGAVDRRPRDQPGQRKRHQPREHGAAFQQGEGGRREQNVEHHLDAERPAAGHQARGRVVEAENHQQVRNDAKRFERRHRRGRRCLQQERDLDHGGEREQRREAEKAADEIVFRASGVARHSIRPRIHVGQTESAHDEEGFHAVDADLLQERIQQRGHREVEPVGVVIEHHAHRAEPAQHVDRLDARGRRPGPFRPGRVGCRVALHSSSLAPPAPAVFTARRVSAPARVHSSGYTSGRQSQRPKRLLLPPANPDAVRNRGCCICSALLAPTRPSSAVRHVAGAGAAHTAVRVRSPARTQARLGRAAAASSTRSRPAALAA